MQIQTRKISINGTELSYIEKGKGDPVVFVHGSLNDLRSWMSQVETFSELYRAITYSKRGHWPGPLIDERVDYSAAVHAKDLGAFIEAIGARPAHIVSHSYGAYSALILAARRPDLIRTLILAEPPLFSWLDSVPGGNRIKAEYMDNVWLPTGQAFKHGDLKGGIRVFIEGTSGKGTFDRLHPPALGMIMDNAPAMASQTSAIDQFPEFTCKDAQKIEMPSLILTGELSPKIMRLIMDELGRCLPGGELSVIPGASHNMHTANPKAFNEAVLGFLARH